MLRFQPKLSQWCKENDVLMIGYSPFGSPDLPWGRTDLPHILVDPTLQEIAKQVGKSTAQVVLRWNIQGGLGICGKSVFENELGKKNFRAFRAKFLSRFFRFQS